MSQRAGTLVSPCRLTLLDFEFEIVCVSNSRHRDGYRNILLQAEYFLIDRNFFLARPDLLNTGRTLFRVKPPKGQPRQARGRGLYISTHLRDA